MLFIGASTKASAQERCLVADPTGTPLNVRIAPNGRITQTLINGVLVMIFDRSSVKGKNGSTLEDTKIAYLLGGCIATT